MIRLLHTSDWHLGRMLYGRSLLEDQEWFIDRVFLPAVVRESPDAVLLSGDVYDRSVAPVEAIRLFDRVITALSRQGVPLLVIAGNHDGADRLAVGAELLRRQGITIVSNLEEAMQPVLLQKEGERVLLHPLPYFDPPQARAFLKKPELRGFFDSFEAVLSQVKEDWDEGAVHVLMAHCFVTGCAPSDSERPVYVGGSGDVSSSLFSGFAYVALGHLHAPQRAGDNGRYSGSPLKYSFDEARHNKSMTLVELDKGVVATRQIIVEPLRDLREISGSFGELLAAGRQQPCADYLLARLTDTAPVYLPMEQLRAYYPNLLGIRSEWRAVAPGEGQEALRAGAAGKDDRLILESFLQQICREEATEEDFALFQALCAQAEEEDS